MLLVYWGAQRMPSGWISVLFGLTPIVTGVLAHWWLGERRLGGLRLMGVFLGLLGLAVVFAGGRRFSGTAWQGLTAVSLAVLLHSVSSVWTKRVDHHAHGLVLTCGGLLVALPAYLVTWWLLDAQWPERVPIRPALTILYLGAVATAGGFSLYYWVLRHLDATRVAMLTLFTLLLAMGLGWLLNGEPLSWSVLGGAMLILSGLALYELGEWRLRRSPFS